MVGKWLLVVVPLLVDFNIVTPQPISNAARQVDLNDCCPCHHPTRSRSPGELLDDSTSQQCPCRPLADDAEASASFLLPALRAVQPLVKQLDQKTEPKPLLQPEVGLASSVLETLRQATDEEYQDALARDAARSAVQLLESTLDPIDDAVIGTPKNKVRIFLNKNEDDMDDNLPEPSHIQETRCIHSPLQSVYKHGQLRVSRPTPIIEVFELSPKPPRKLNNKNVMHRKILDMDNGIGASNIKEHIIQPNLDGNHLKSNPALFDIFTQNDLGQTEDQQEIQKNRSDKFAHNHEFIPNLPFKLREIINNLESRKGKVPIIDFKKYISPATRITNLQSSPIEKAIHNKPLLLKDLLKLRDVELIPKKSNTKITTSKQPTLKLQSETSKLNLNICDQGNSNVVPLINENTEMNTIPIYTETADPETSPTDSNPIYEPKSNIFNSKIHENFKPTESIGSSISSVPEDFEDQDNFDYGEEKPEEETNESNKNGILSENCIDDTGNSFIQQLPNDDNREKALTNNDLRKGKVKKLDNENSDTSRDESNETFQIDFLEDFDTPIEFDNSSFVPKSYVKNNENMNAFKENSLNDPIADTSNNVFQRNDEDAGIPSKNNRDEIVDDCNSLESFLKQSNSIRKDQISVAESSMQQLSSEASNNGFDIFTDINEDPSQVTFKDLQDMSNSVLNLSECESPRDENVNTGNNLNEGLNQINNGYDMTNTSLTTSAFKTIPKDIETDDFTDSKSSFITDSKLIKASDTNLNEKMCTSTTLDESLSEINQTDINELLNSETQNSEMRAEASEQKPKSYEYMDRNTLESNKDSNIFARRKTKTNDILNIDKNSMFFNNLKSKLQGLVSTTEKQIVISNNPDDNANESSNIKPTLAKSDRLQRIPPTLGKISLPELPRMSLDSFSNKLALPNLVNIQSPFEDTLDPGLAFTTLSDKLRSHTENTIQNVKQTLESTLKDSQNIRFSRPNDAINFDTHDILESISNKRDEMKEKLEAIHLDFNDRFSSIQQSILDHFNVPDEHSEFVKGRNNGQLGSSFIPVRQELSLPEASTFRNVKSQHNSIPHRVNALKNGKHTEINIVSSKLPSVSDATRLLNTDRKLQNSAFYSTTTPIPSFVPRLKVLKTNIGSTPKLTSNTRNLKATPIKKTLPEEKLSKIKAFSLKPENNNNLFEESYSSRLNSPGKSFKPKTEKINKANLSIDSPVHNFRKSLLQNNLSQKSKHGSANNLHDGDTMNTLDKKGYFSTTQESLLSRMKEGTTRTGSRNNDAMFASPTSHQDTPPLARSESGLRLVEPMKENVPYKCKLICYKDS